MTMTVAVLLACLACFVLKVVGYVLPSRFVEGPRISRITTLLPAALLAALIANQTFVSNRALVVDSRLVAVGVALVLLWRRANFIVVVLVAAVVAAALRAAGMP